MAKRKNPDQPPTTKPGADLTVAETTALAAGGTPTDELPSEEAAAPSSEPQETCREYLRRNFPPEEMAHLGLNMAQVDQEILKAKEELTTIKADFKSRITRLETERSDYSRKINGGYEMANIECIITRDHDRKLVIITRPDTGEIVRERKMTIDELQRSLLPPETTAEVGEHFGVEKPLETVAGSEVPPDTTVIPQGESVTGDATIHF